MKAYAIAVTAIVLASTVSASSQSEGPYYSNTIHQSVGGRDSRGYPKYYQPAPRSRAAETSGAGDNLGGEPPGPYYSNTIHQSVGGARFARLSQILRALIAVAIDRKARKRAAAAKEGGHDAQALCAAPVGRGAAQAACRPCRLDSRQSPRRDRRWRRAPGKS